MTGTNGQQPLVGLLKRGQGQEKTLYGLTGVGKLTGRQEVLLTNQFSSKGVGTETKRARGRKHTQSTSQLAEAEGHKSSITERNREEPDSH